MRSSTSFKYLLNYLSHIKTQKGFSFETLHLAILRCIQMFSELRDHGDTSSEVQYVLDELAKLTPLIASKKISPTDKIMTDLISYLEDKELDLFEEIYPHIQILFSFIILNSRYPLESDLFSLGISIPDYIFYLNLMFEYYYYGEPVFKNNENDFESGSVLIRGREIQVVATEILQKYSQIWGYNTQTLWLPKVIVDGGYSFYDANRIALYLENRGVQISRTFFLQSKNDDSLDTSINKLEEIYNSYKQTHYHFFSLNWQKSFPDDNKYQDRFCPRCGLPFKKKMLLFKEGISSDACDICVDI